MNPVVKDNSNRFVIMNSTFCVIFVDNFFFLRGIIKKQNNKERKQLFFTIFC